MAEASVVRLRQAGPMPRFDVLSRRPAVTALAVAGVAYAASLAYLMRTPGQSLAEPLFLLAFLGVVFPALAWALTRRPRTDAASIPSGPARVPAVLAYLALFSLAVLGFGFSAVNTVFPDEPAQSV